MRKISSINCKLRIFLRTMSLVKFQGDTGGQPGYSQSEQKLVTPAVLAKQVIPVCSTGQTGIGQVRLVAQTD